MADVEPWIAELVAHAHRETPAVTPTVASSASAALGDQLRAGQLTAGQLTALAKRLIVEMEPAPVPEGSP